MRTAETAAARAGHGAPSIGEHWVELIAIGLFGLMSVQVWGAVSVLGQLGLLALLVFLRPWSSLDLVTRWSFLFALPVMAVMSAMWSMAPEISLRYGTQLLITALIGGLAARVLSPRAFVRVLFIATLAVCVGSLIDGHKGVSATGMVLVGLTGSKNQISYLAQILVTSAVAVMVDPRQPRPLRTAAVVSTPYAAWLLIQANAATGVVTTVAGIMIFFAALALMLTRPIYRAIVLAGVLAACIPTAVAMPVLVEAAQDFTFNVLKKDSTLTGRTYLWARADELISDRPVLGHGYRAIWLGSSTESVGLLRWAGVPDPRGFHFHDSYREMAVDLGLVGAFIFATTLLLIGLGLSYKAVMTPTIPTAYFLSLFAMLAMRSKGDLVVGPFSPYFAVQFSLAIYALQGLAHAVARVFTRLAPDAARGHAGRRLSRPPPSRPA